VKAGSVCSRGYPRFVEASVRLGEASVRLGEASVRLGEASVRLGEGRVRLGEGRVRLGEGRVRLAGGGVRLDDHEVPGIYIRDLYCLCDITRLSTYALPPLQREMPESFDIVLLCKITKKREKRIAKAENKEKKPKAAS
jgi:hypothetical protein